MNIYRVTPKKGSPWPGFDHTIEIVVIASSEDRAFEIALTDPRGFSYHSKEYIELELIDCTQEGVISFDLNWQEF